MVEYEWLYNPIFMIIAMGYFITLGVITLRYAFNTRQHPKKVHDPTIFYNEVLIGILFFFLAVVYPFIFDNIVVGTENPGYIKAQMYFHLWDSLTINLIIWNICIPIWKKNNIKKNRVMSYEEWAQKFTETYNARSPFISDVKRKMMHLIPAGVIIGIYYLSVYLEPRVDDTYGWDALSFSMYSIIAIGIHFLFVMNIADQLRLQKWDSLGKFARDWAEDAMKPSELYTYTSANTMILAWVPFVMAKPIPHILFTVALIGSLADAMASIVGKSIGKIKPKGMIKTVEGFIAGSLTAFALVYFVNWILPYPDANSITVFIMALAAAFGFLMVDIFAKRLSDNFTNPVVVGLLIGAIYHLMV